MKAVSKRGMSLVAAAIMATGLFANAQAADEETKVEIVTLPSGSVAHGAAVALAGVVGHKSSIKLIAAGYGGPQVLVPLVDEGKAAFTLLNTNDVASAMAGAAPAYKQRHQNLRLISNGYRNAIGIVVRADSDIRTPADLKGKRVTGVFSAHKTCAKLASATIANAGLTWDDVKVVPVTSTVPSIRALAEGRADAALCGAIGMAVIKEVNAQVPVRFVSLNASPDAEERAQAVFTGGRIAKAAKGSDEAIREDTNMFEYDFYLVGGKQLPDELVTGILEVIWDSHQDLVEANRTFRDWTQDRMATDNMSIPYHPAAIAFFKDKGVWTEAMEERNQALLAKIQ